ncbi:MAG: hypothetical protein RLZZ143_164 [Cyanobacteriota bacterium]|jgi:hypothetical protein
MMNDELSIRKWGDGVWGRGGEGEWGEGRKKLTATKGLKRRLYLLKSIFIKKLIDYNL